MKLKNIGSNQTEVEIGGTCFVFFSYNTPVAACLNGNYFKTSKKWSKTTSKHINAWIGDNKVQERPQEYFDKLIAI